MTTPKKPNRRPSQKETAQPQASVDETKVPPVGPVPEQDESKAPVRSEAEVLRSAFAGNYFQHCVNACADEAEKAGKNPLFVGSVDCLSELIGGVIGAGGQEQMSAQVEAVMQAIDRVTVGNMPLAVLIARRSVAMAAQQGLAFSALGDLQSVAMDATMMGLRNSILHELTNPQGAPEGEPVDPANPPAAPAEPAEPVVETESVAANS